MTSTSTLLLRTVVILRARQRRQLRHSPDTPLSNVWACSHSVQQKAAVRLRMHANSTDMLRVTVRRCRACSAREGDVSLCAIISGTCSRRASGA